VLCAQHGDVSPRRAPGARFLTVGGSHQRVRRVGISASNTHRPDVIPIVVTEGRIGLIVPSSGMSAGVIRQIDHVGVCTAACPADYQIQWNASVSSELPEPPCGHPHLLSVPAGSGRKGRPTRPCNLAFEHGNWISFHCCGDSEWSVRPRKACPPAVHSPGVGLTNPSRRELSHRHNGRAGEVPT